MKNLILALAALSIVAIAPSASAQVSLAIDSTNRLYVYGLTANTEYPVTMTTSVITRRLLANQCGLITVPTNNPSNFISLIVVDGNNVVPSLLEVKAVPRCVNGVLDIPTTDNFRSPRGQTILVGQVPNLAIDIEIAAPRVRNFTTDACGILRIPNSSSFPVSNSSNIAIGDRDSPLFFGAVPNIFSSSSNPDICVQGVKYQANSEFPL